MIEKKFAEMVVSAKDSEDIMLYLLEKLNPLIQSYTKKLFFLEKEDARQELMIAIIEAVQAISKCENDGQCLNYINNAVKFRFANLCKRNIKQEKIHNKYEKELHNIAYFEKYVDIEMEYDLQEKRNSLTKNQKKILDYLLLGCSDKEISEKLGISRQYINRIKKSFI